MKFRLINYGDSDYEKMVELRTEVLRKPLGLHFSQEYLENEKDTILIGGFEDEKIIACCLLRKLSEDVIQLQQMAVAPELQKHHIGSELIAFAEEQALQAGFSKLFMHARKTAIGFYQKLGYEIIGDEFEEVNIPHFMMKKDLNHTK